MASPLRHLDVCAGVGGFSLGLRLALGDDVRTVGYVERSGFAVAVLLARMEDETLERAPVWCAPLDELDGRELRGQVDILTAGYPCQPYSAAGQQRGDADPRAIWPQIARLIAQAAPPLVLLENVSRRALRGPWRDLLRMGYTLPHPVVVSAAELGAGHHRRRWLVLAYRDVEDDARAPVGPNGPNGPQPGAAARDRDHEGQPQPDGCVGAQRGRYLDAAWWAAEPSVARVVSRVPHRVDRERVLGNAVVPAVVARAWLELTGVKPR